jgi:hypothetical protein
MAENTLILTTNHLGHKPGGGREHRLIDPNTLRTSTMVITDDCGQGGQEFTHWLKQHKVKWERISNLSPRAKAHYAEEMLRRIHMAPASTPGHDTLLTEDASRIAFLMDEYPHILRGAELDHHAETHDLRHYDRPETQAEA